MKNPIVDIIATVMVMLTLGILGYWWLTSEADKVLQHKQQHQLHPEKVHEKREVEKSTMERLAPKSFAAVVKRTEME